MMAFESMSKSPFEPIVSVGMPVKNGGKNFKNALISITSQTEKNIEIIISNNKSTDNTFKNIMGLINGDERIKFFNQSAQLTAQDNFKFVLSKARGKYFLWAAHDDTRDNNFIKVLSEGLKKNPNAILDLVMSILDKNMKKK